MPETEINVLPNEMLEIIFSYFCSETLDTTFSSVCTRWQGVAEQVMNRRVVIIERKIPPETLTELKTHFIGTDKDLKLQALKKFECLYMAPGFRFRNYTREQRNGNENSVVKLAETSASNFRSHMRTACDALARHEVLELDALFKPVPCHQLIIAVQNQDLIFYHESVLWKPPPFPTGAYRPYEVKSLGLLDDGLTSGVINMDVYQDKVAVVYQPLDTLVLYQITEVCHKKFTVTIRPLKRMYFPLRSQAITFYKDKIYVLYTNFYLGVWPVTSDSAEAKGRISKTNIPRPRVGKSNPDILMFRVNNLLFIRIFYTFNYESWFPNDTRWQILDMNEDTLESDEVPMLQILLRLIPRSSDGSLVIGERILRLQISGNVLLIHAVRRYCARQADLCPYPPQTAHSNREDVLFAFTLKLDPKKDDFLDLKKFDRLRDGPSASTTLDIIHGFIRALPSSCFGTTKPTFVGISNTNRRSPTSTSVITLALSNSEDKPSGCIG